MRRPAAVVVGAGLMGHWHARAARRAGARVVGIIDADLSLARQLAARHPGAQAHTSLSAALESGEVSICHVCTPLPSHATVAGEALAAGAHVLVEKPFTDSSASTRALLEMAAARGLLAVPVHQFVHQRGVHQARRWLARIGPLRQVRFTACSAGAAGRGAAEADRVASEILPHPLSLLGYLVPGALVAAEWRGIRPAPGEWMVQAAVQGVGVQLLVSMGGRPPVNELRLVGEGGAITCDLFHGYADRESGAVSRPRKMLRPFARAVGQGTRAAANLLHRTVTGEFAYPGLNRLVERFYLAVEGSGPPPAGAEEILAIAAARERICAAVGSAA